MKVSPGTEFALDQLRVLEVFEGLSDDQLDWIRSHSERLDVLADEILARPEDPADHMQVLVSGSYQWKFSVGGQNTVFTESRPGSVGGMLPFSRARKNSGEARALTDAVGLRIHKDHFAEMLNVIPALGQRLVSIMSDRVRRSTQVVDHREKMSALGKMAAGLAHELNNPASALKRSALTLRDRLTNMLSIGAGLISLNVSGEEIKAAAELRDELLARKIDDLTPLQRAEREDELSDWLEEKGIPEPWVLAENLAELGATTAELDKLAAGVGHIDGALSLGVRWIEGSAGMHRMVGEIISASERIAHLVQSIKVHAHMDSNPDKQPVDLRDGIESTLTILAHKLRKKSIKVKRVYDETIPKVPAYPGELNQVWTNLIDNAIDAMDEGGTLTLKTCKEGGCVCVRVCDDGQGIPSDVLSRIFEPFFTTKAMGEGTGIGLDIVHRIVTAQHGGDIKVESSPGSTCFSVWFPLTPASRTSAP